MTTRPVLVPQANPYLPTGDDLSNRSLSVFDSVITSNITQVRIAGDWLYSDPSNAPISILLNETRDDAALVGNATPYTLRPGSAIRFPFRSATILASAAVGRVRLFYGQDACPFVEGPDETLSAVATVVSGNTVPGTVTLLTLGSSIGGPFDVDVRLTRVTAAAETSRLRCYIDFLFTDAVACESMPDNATVDDVAVAGVGTAAGLFTFHQVPLPSRVVSGVALYPTTARLQVIDRGNAATNQVAYVATIGLK